jgi:uncharacterized membrane protein YadS
MEKTNKKWSDGMFSTEDWWSAWLGLFFFALGLLSIWGLDAVGWIAKPKTWEFSHLIQDFSWGKLIKTSSKAYHDLHPLASLLITYVVIGGLMTIGAYFQKLQIRKFITGFTAIFFLTWLAWIVGHEAHLSAVDAVVKKHNYYKEFDLNWGIQLGGGASYMLALLIGLLIGNVFKKFASKIKEAAKPEWFIKTGIVLLGIKLGLMTMKAAGFTYELTLAGAAAAFVAYLLFWPIVYYIGRKYFKLNRASAAVLSSGISICGVSASIATAGAIKAKPVIPIAVSTLILVFAMFEMVILPPVYTNLAPHQPIVNGAAMGMTVKTDGADAAAGAILDELMVSKHIKNEDEHWEEGWILSASILTKVWIDIFIGIWSFILAVVWLRNVEKKKMKEKIPLKEIWFRLPKFVLAYMLVWLIYIGIMYFLPDIVPVAKSGGHIVQGAYRKLMFMLTFLSIGIITDFSKLKGMGRLTLLYAIALFGIIAPIAYVVAYIFHHGMLPPIAK